MCNSSPSLPYPSSASFNLFLSSNNDTTTTNNRDQLMANTNFSLSISNLICDEDTPNLNEYTEEEEEDNEAFILFSETEEDEYIEALASRESSFGSRAIIVSSVAQTLLRCARSDSVRWVLKMKAYFGFGCQTVYLAMSYFDRFMVHRSIDEGKTWAWKLLSVSCLSLAAKMEECMPPALSEYRLEEYRFSSNVIQRMELLVLNTLEWRMSSVTPFAYLGYFATKLECKCRRKDLFSRAIGFIFAIIEAMDLVDSRPSEIAAASILAASSDRLTKNSLQSKMSRISLPESLETENVFCCYNEMIRESQKGNLRPPKPLVSSDVSANLATINTAPSFSSVTSNKRRRLQ